MKQALIILLILTCIYAVLSGLGGYLLSNAYLYPHRRPLSANLIDRTDRRFASLGAARADFEVQAQDGIRLRGWIVTPIRPNGDWVVALHGVGDNRVGMLGHASLLLRRGYGVLMMDTRAHGASEGARATYGWRERHDLRTIVAELSRSRSPHCLFLFGESMGASIALQSASIEPEINGVVAESPFSNLKEVSFDYAGLRLSHWLGRTLFRPAAEIALYLAQYAEGFDAAEVSPEKAVAMRPFPVLLICGIEDRNIPARHTERIYAAATGSREIWLVEGATHTGALGASPEEFERRVLSFLERIHQEKR